MRKEFLIINALEHQIINSERHAYYQGSIHDFNNIEIHSMSHTKRLKVYVMPTQIAQRNVQ